MKRNYLVTLALCLIVCATAQAAKTTTAKKAAAHPNPFLKASTLPFQAPPFDRIKDSDYKPALEEGMRVNLHEIEAIANNPKPATFANTIEAMERSGALLTRTAKVFFALTGSNTNDTIQKIE